MLNNIVKKLKEDKKATIVYLGGSVTGGFGSTNADELSWRALSGKHFKEQFPDAEINLIKASVGGTGSGFGRFRLQKDVLDHNPDLVFIEFAFNDFEYSPEESHTYYEGLIHTINKANPETEIIMVIITCDGRMKNGQDAMSKTHHRIAEYYNIPIIDFIPAVNEDMKANNRDMAYYLRDIVHPNDTGYAFYADIVNKFIDENIVGGTFGEVIKYNLPKPEMDNLLLGDTTTIEYNDFKPTASKGFSVQDDTPNNPYFMGNEQGDYFEFSFEGTHLSAWFALGGRDHKIEGGADEIECYADGELVKTVSVKSYSGAMKHITLFNGLENKKHNVKLLNKSGGRCLIKKIFLA